MYAYVYDVDVCWTMQECVDDSEDGDGDEPEHEEEETEEDEHDRVLRRLRGQQ